MVVLPVTTLYIPKCKQNYIIMNKINLEEKTIEFIKNIAI